MARLDFEKNLIYYEEEINKLVKEQKQNVSEQDFKWILYNLEKSGKLSRVGTKKYIAGMEKYRYKFLTESEIVDGFISRVFPKVNYVIWESVQLNEWANLLINQNTIFIDIEKELFDFVADGLIEEFGTKYTILVNPSTEDVARYRRDNLIILKKLFSRSPLAKKDHKIKLEKLMVDLLCDKYYVKMLDSRTVDDVFRGVKKNYAVDTTKMFNYAKRRNVLTSVKTLWDDKND